MTKVCILGADKELADEMVRCCNQYSSLDIAVAWFGNPERILPFELLEKFKGSISATVGVSFKHTHPEAIRWFKKRKSDIRIYNDSGPTFHPKIYLFRKSDRYALFIGSSNFTFQGFCANVEANVLIEGGVNEANAVAIKNLREKLANWHSGPRSFEPKEKWLKEYTKQYNVAKEKERKYGIRTESGSEREIPVASWLRFASWDVYYKKIVDGLELNTNFSMGYRSVLDQANRLLSVPWHTNYFDDIERRRLIGGMSGHQDYGWLGNVAAAGKFRGLMANGSKHDKLVLVSALNKVAKLKRPIHWNTLESELKKLVALGPTMKVWGRLLCLVRPDLYCTVSSTTVRTTLSKILGVPQISFSRPQGYVHLIKEIHASPWFNASKPKNAIEANIWRRRAAYLDVIFR